MCSSLRALLLGATVSMSAQHLTAQAPDPAAAQDAISRLDFMVGRWRGTAWQQRGGERVQTQMLEVVERKLGGAVLLVEGRGTVPVPGADERVVHHALGVISFDPRTSTYTLRSHLATGQRDGTTWTQVMELRLRREP